MPPPPKAPKPLKRDLARILEEFHTTTDAKASKLDLANCGLTQLPRELMDFGEKSPRVAERVHILNLAHNELDDLPDWLENTLPNIRILFCLGNKFTKIPDVIAKLNKCTMISFKNCNLQGVVHAKCFPSKIEWLILTGNCIEELSEDFPTTCWRIRKFMLSNNRISKLPADFYKLEHLELLRIANNYFKHVPVQCLDCPNLKWLALGGNPCVENLVKLPHIMHLPQFDKLYEFKDGKHLGSGTSGNVISAMRKSDNTPVAAKIFKANQGSDGRALDEVAVSLQAKNIKGLVQAEQAARQGNQLMLITKLVPGEPKALANPPSFQSCTRSVYDDKVKLSQDDAMHIVQTVSNGLHALHERGIAHGDVYAHNVLVGQRQSDGMLSVALGDLGAAWPFPKEIGNLVRAVEQRALHVLENEVMQRTT